MTTTKKHPSYHQQSGIAEKAERMMQNGWSDAKIASSLSISSDYVKRIREAMGRRK